MSSLVRKNATLFGMAFIIALKKLALNTQTLQMIAQSSQARHWQRRNISYNGHMVKSVKNST
jgi:hypothetical protein